MSLVSMKPILAKASAEGYGVGAFNILDYQSAKAVIDAADELQTPVIVQASVKTVRYWGASTLAGWVTTLAEHADVPVALHLDHCTDESVIRECIEAGWTSVMYDGSALPVSDNLAATKRVLALAEPIGVGVEAELGQIGGVEDDLVVDEAEAHLADPDIAVQFCDGLPLAAFAPAIGTAHGFYNGEPKIAFDRIETIANRTKLPIALHGGTGLDDQTIRRCIRLGCAKVNISTELKHVFIDGFVQHHQQHNGYEPLKVLAAQYERMKEVVSRKIALFGTANATAAQ